MSQTLDIASDASAPASSTRAQTQSTRPTGALPRAWALTYTVLWALTLSVATIAAITPSGPALARELLQLKLSPVGNPPPSLSGVVSITINNTLHSVWPLTLGPLGAAGHRVTRRVADGAVAANLLVCALLAGGALAGYGTAAIAYVPNVPLEWAGIAAGASGWAIERKGPLSRRGRTIILALNVLLLAGAATIESCLVPRR